jgi:hypothetical protein
MSAAADHAGGAGCSAKSAGWWSSRKVSSSCRQNREALAERVAMAIGAENGAATGPIPSGNPTVRGSQTSEARSKLVTGIISSSLRPTKLALKQILIARPGTIVADQTQEAGTLYLAERAQDI